MPGRINLKERALFRLRELKPWHPFKPWMTRVRASLDHLRTRTETTMTKKTTPSYVFLFLFPGLPQQRNLKTKG